MDVSSVTLWGLYHMTMKGIYKTLISTLLLQHISITIDESIQLDEYQMKWYKGFPNNLSHK